MYIDMTMIGPTGRNFKWVRIPVEKFLKAIEQMERKNPLHIYSTVQLFFEPQQIENEKHISPFYMDIDSSDLNQSLDEAKLIIDYFQTSYTVEEGIKCWFSGNKGFHITICEKLFEAEPCYYLHKIWRSIAEEIKKHLSLECLDMSVYTKRRMWRVENTLHGKSKLYKIPLLPWELMSFDIEKIKQMAQHKREVIWNEEE